MTPLSWAKEPRWSQVKMLAFSMADNEMQSEEAKEIKAKMDRKKT